MIHIKKGARRLPVRVCKRAAIFVVLICPAVFAQKTKTVPSATPAVPPAKVDSRSELNDRIAQLATISTVKQGDYVIGSGDVLAVEVFDVPELSRDVRVNETGFVSLPLIPVKIHVAGLTTFQLQDKLAELLQTNGLVSTPQVSVAVKEQHSQPITVIGSVKNPMVIQAVRQTTLLQVLSQAGGVADDAGSVVVVTRQPSTGEPRISDEPKAPAEPRVSDEPKTSAEAKTSDAVDSTNIAGEPQTFLISLNDLLDTGNATFNIPILGGDVVSVPRAGIIYVVGAVQRPGGFVMQSDRDRMTTMKILSLAGGTTPSAKQTQAVILRKNPETGKRDEVAVNLKKVLQLKTEDVMLQPSDILYVPDSSGKRALRRAGDVAIGLTTGIALVTASKY